MTQLPIPNSQFPKRPVNLSTRQLLNSQTLTISIADSTLILSHRLSQWCGHGPVLEQDIALTNISLDLLGQARAFYQYAAELMNKNNSGDNVVTEDSLAYLRDVRDFRNHLLTELPNGDWGHTILRLFFFSVYQFHFYNELQKSSDMQLASIAIKSLKEVSYHRRWSSEWVIRLGDGTDESKTRMEKALQELWPFTGELFMETEFEKICVEEKIGVNISQLKSLWEKDIAEVFEEATLTVPESKWFQQGGKEGNHTEHLGYILAEMQFLQRAYPGSEW